MKDYYSVLRIEKNATEDEIKTAYKKLVKTIHPDKNEGDTYFEKWSMELNEAYEILNNAARRKEYDAQLLYEEGKAHRTSDFSSQSKQYTDSSIVVKAETILKVRNYLNDYFSLKSNIQTAEQNLKSFANTPKPDHFTSTSFLVCVAAIMGCLVGIKFSMNLSAKPTDTTIPQADLSTSSSARHITHVTASTDAPVDIPESAENIYITYFVKNDNTFLLSSPDISAKTSVSLKDNYQFTATRSYDGFVYSDQIIINGKRRKGWISVNDVEVVTVVDTIHISAGTPLNSTAGKDSSIIHEDQPYDPAMSSGTNEIHESPDGTEKKKPSLRERMKAKREARKEAKKVNEDNIE